MLPCAKRSAAPCWTPGKREERSTFRSDADRSRQEAGGQSGDDDREKDLQLAITFAALAVVPLLVVLRAFDDNTLASWNWVFATPAPVGMALFVPAAVGLCFLFARSGILERSPLVWLPLLAFLAVLPLWREPEMVLDSSRYFLQAKHLELYGIGSFFREWGTSITAWTDLPLVPFLFGLIFRYAGETRCLVQAFTSLLFSLTLVLTCLIGKRLYDRETGTNAALLLLGIPFLLVQVPLMLVDVPTMFFVTLALAAFMEALYAGGPARTCVASAALFSALFSKYSAGLMLLVLPAVVIILMRSGHKNALWRALLVTAPAAGLAIAVLLVQHDVIRSQLSLLVSYQLPGLGRWHEGLASSFLFQTHPFVTVAAAAGFVQAVRKRDIRFAIPCWFFLFVLFVQHERIRYFLPLFPLLTLMAARGIAELPGKTGRRYLVYCVAATSVVVAAAGYVPFFERTSMANLQEAGRFLDGLGEVGPIEVRTLPQLSSTGNTEMTVPLLDLYTRQRLIVRRHEAATPGRQAVERSPLRFSWETPLPAYYREGKIDTPCPVVVISSRSQDPAAPDHAGMPAATPLAQFHSFTGVFRFRCMVTVFGPDCLGRTGQ